MKSKLRLPFLIALIGVILLIFLGGCNNHSEQTKLSEVNAMATYTYDTCEYVGMNLFWQSAVLVHKGNCKYCIQRQKGDTIK